MKLSAKVIKPDMVKLKEDLRAAAEAKIEVKLKEIAREAGLYAADLLNKLALDIHSKTPGVQAFPARLQPHAPMGIPSWAFKRVETVESGRAVKVVIERSGLDQIFDWLNAGTGGFVQPNTVVIEISNAYPRSQPGTLEVKPGSDDAHTVILREGQQIAGIEARKFTDTVIEKVAEKFSNQTITINIRVINTDDTLGGVPIWRG